jgi:hypothetical protein
MLRKEGAINYLKETETPASGISRQLTSVHCPWAAATGTLPNPKNSLCGFELNNPKVIPNVKGQPIRVISVRNHNDSAAAQGLDNRKS